MFTFAASKITQHNSFLIPGHRMESTGSSWRIHMSQTTCDRLEQTGGYIIEPRGPIEIKGKGKMNTYWLLGKKGFDKVLPTPPPIG
jgi:guanylate cyclase 2F